MITNTVPSGIGRFRVYAEMFGQFKAMVTWDGILRIVRKSARRKTGFGVRVEGD